MHPFMQLTRARSELVCHGKIQVLAGSQNCSVKIFGDTATFCRRNDGHWSGLKKTVHYAIESEVDVLIEQVQEYVWVERHHQSSYIKLTVVKRREFMISVSRRRDTSA